MGVLNSIDSIDWIVVFEEDTPYELYSLLKPDILVKGGDYTRETVVGKDFCAEVKLFPFAHSVSTTEISERIKQST
jgi:D-beta-D-heptose 7-phosphate kinase/D-beta-D-heptose 1-phosphate adenosyltransferase